MRRISYSNDQLQESIRLGHQLVLHVNNKGDRQALLIYIPKETK